MAINENNRFYINRKAIGALADARHVSTNTACTMYAVEHWGQNGWERELDEFMALVKKCERAKDEVTKATEHMDKNKDGHINTADLFE